MPRCFLRYPILYGHGATDQLLGETLAGFRERVFLVSKVLPSNAGRGRIAKGGYLLITGLIRVETDPMRWPPTTTEE